MAPKLHFLGRMNLIAGVLYLLVATTTDPVVRPSAPTADQLKAYWDLQWMLGPGSTIPSGRPPAPTKKLSALGISLYRQRCSGCHGENGDGKGPLASRLRIPPTSFTQGLYKLRSTPSTSLPTDEDIFTTVTRGMHGTPMLPWKHLSETDRWALVYRLKSFSARFQQERPQSPIVVPRPPKEDDAMRANGKRLYTFLECASCHGDRGTADGPAADAYRRADPNHDVPIRDFTRGRFIRGTQMEDIFLTLKTGLDGTSMGSYEALIRDDETWALAAYIRTLIRERPVQEFPPARTLGSAETAARPGSTARPRSPPPPAAQQPGR